MEFILFIKRPSYRPIRLQNHQVLVEVEVYCSVVQKCTYYVARVKCEGIEEEYTKSAYICTSSGE